MQIIDNIKDIRIRYLALFFFLKRKAIELKIKIIPRSIKNGL
jgi:hypothetical protein